jgi:hypothetical protein
VLHESGCGTFVWTGRALQAGFDDLETIGLALLYPALARRVYTPGHHGYPRAIPADAPGNARLLSPTADVPSHTFRGSYVQILLQKSKVAAARIFGETGPGALRIFDAFGKTTFATISANRKHRLPPSDHLGCRKRWMIPTMSKLDCFTLREQWEGALAPIIRAAVDAAS